MEFQLLGPLEARSPGGQVALGGPRQRAVLAALLMRPNRVSTMGVPDRGRVGAAGGPPESNIRTYVSGLRRGLGERACRLTAQPGGYRFSVHPGEVDAVAFTELISRADAALRSGDRGARPTGQFGGRSGSGAAARWRACRWERRCRPRWCAWRNCGCGPRIAGSGGGRAWPPRRDRQRPVRPGRGTRWTRACWADLMSALHSTGRRAEVLDVYARVRRRLIEELGAEPGPRPSPSPPARPGRQLAPAHDAARPPG